jgi:tetratricopeptide (TPR) repeat protein
VTKACAEYERALEIGLATIGPDHPNMATRHNNLGLVLRELGDLPGARAEYERALEIGQAALGPTTPPWPSSAATSTIFCSNLVVHSAEIPLVLAQVRQLSFADVE